MIVNVLLVGISISLETNGTKFKMINSLCTVIN